MPKVIDSIEWRAFLEQKKVLNEAIYRATHGSHSQECLTGILNLMDALQDTYQPAFCPRCGGTNTTDCTFWTAYRDTKNIRQLTEYQCLDCDSASFWK